MRVGDIGNEEALPFGKPLEGVRILAAEQMQALPWATQLLARLGAEVVKVEHPVHGESGRASLPGMTDPEGRNVGATFLRNNLNKKSVGLDLKSPKGRELFIEMAGQFDIVAENFKAGTMKRLGLDYDTLAEIHPSLIYVSVSGFGNTGDSPYQDWPAYAPVAEAMSGIYEYSRREGEPPRILPVGALGDIGTGLFATIGILAALQHRQRTGLGQYVDIAMLDSLVSITDVVTSIWAMGMRPNALSGIMNAFKASDGYFAVQVVREHQFEHLAKLIGAEWWLTDERLANRSLWFQNTDSVIRPTFEAWASQYTRLEACDLMGKAGIAAGPVAHPDEIPTDPHVVARNMVTQLERTDDSDVPVYIPGNPVKMSKMADGPDTRIPWVGEHTDAVLRDELGIDHERLAELRAEGVIN